MIATAVPGDSRVEAKKKEKIGKYQASARELRELWGVQVQVLPEIVGAVVTIPSVRKTPRRCWVVGKGRITPGDMPIRNS